jgi:uncharacterized protein (TIGR03437 family)
MRLSASALLLVLAVNGQEFPQAVDLIQRIDGAYSWLSVLAMGLDGEGNIYLAGNASAIPNTIQIRQGPLGGVDVVVLKLDPTGQQNLYGEAIGSSKDDSLNLMRVDANGNAYLFITTEGSDFPSWYVQPGSGNYSQAIVKLNNAGAMLYGTVIRWGLIRGLDVDANGSVYFGGIAIRGELPVSPSAYLPSPDGEYLSAGFVAKLNANGWGLDAATYVPSKAESILVRRNGDVLYSAYTTIAALDPSLSHLAFMTGTTLLPQPGLSVNIAEDGLGNIYAIGSRALQKYGPDGQRVLPLPDLAFLGISSFAVTRSGSLLITGAVGPGFPTYHRTQPCSMNLHNPPPNSGGALVVLNADGQVRYSTFMEEAQSFVTISPKDDRPYAIAQEYVLENGKQVTWRGILAFNPNRLPEAHTFAGCLAHSASLRASPIAPGAIMTLFGDDLGPANGVSSTPAGGRVPFDVAGTSVTVDGKAAPLLYVQNGQINFIAPWSLRSDLTRVPICVTRNTDTSCLYALTISTAAGFFAANATIAAINQDGTINSQQHPSPPGSYVSLYMTGIGPLQGSSADGALADLPLQRFTGTTSVGIWTSGACVGSVMPGLCDVDPLDVLYAGSAPTLVNGVNVVIVRIPTTIRTGERWLIASFTAGDRSSVASGDIWLGP